MKAHRITLIGDGIENPGNAQTMIDAAAMFGSECLFRDKSALLKKWHSNGIPANASLPKLLSREVLTQGYAPLIALENLEGAEILYGFRPPDGPRPAVVVGNERHGISEEVLASVSHAVQIPMFARKLNSLNVAAASAVALYYLSRDGGGPMQTSAHPSRRRPELMMIGAQDHVELGSAIRSAGAFGWERLFLEDHAGVWFGGNRAIKTEARAAARQHRNPIYLLPSAVGTRYAFDEVCVVTIEGAGIPLHKANLTRGNRQLIALPDENAVYVAGEDWHRLAKNVKLVSLTLPVHQFVYHYRLIASIALAEVSRQVGQRIRLRAGRPKRQEPFYDTSLQLLLDDLGETVYLEDLEAY